MSNYNIVCSNKGKYTKVKRGVVKAAILYCVLFALIVEVYLYTSHKIQALKEETRIVKTKTNSLSVRLHRLILANNGLDKTMVVLNYLRLERDLSIDRYLSRLNQALSSLAYYYGITSPLEVEVSYQTSSKSNFFTKLHINIKIKSVSDEGPIKFIDSLVKNLKGFTRIQEIEILKNQDDMLLINEGKSDIVTCNLKLDWYFIVPKESKDAFVKGRVIIKPAADSSIDVEDFYRVSLWEGSLMSAS